MHKLIALSAGTYENQEVRTSKEQNAVETKHEERARCHLDETVHSTVVERNIMIREVSHLDSKHCAGPGMSVPFRIKKQGDDYVCKISAKYFPKKYNHLMWAVHDILFKEESGSTWERAEDYDDARPNK